MKYEKPKIPESAEKGNPEMRILEALEARRKEAPKITKRKPLTPEQIAERQKIDPEELEKNLQKRIGAFAEKMKTAVGYPDEESTELIEDIYNLYLAADSSESGSPDWLANFKSFEDFNRHFCPTATLHAKAFIKKNLQWFFEVVVHPMREITVANRSHDWDKDSEIYLAEGKWALLPDRFNFGNTFRFAEAGVIREIIALINEGYKTPDYTHATGSAALKNIGEQKAILSAREAVKKGIRPETGEFTSYIGHQDQPVSGGNEGLTSVYADRGGPRYGYHVLNWFNDFFVTFGINKDRQEEFLKTTDFRYGWQDRPQELSADYGGEGVLIGNLVPLSAVDIVYAWKQYQDQTAGWVRKYCPKAKTISIEAAEILHGFGDIINAMALQERISPAEAWAKLLE